MKTKLKAFGLGWIKGTLYAVVLYAFSLTMLQATFPTNYYEVYVKYRAGGCYETKRVIIPAQSSNEAKLKAERLVQLGIQTRVTKYAKLK